MRKRDKNAGNIINLEASTDPVSGGIVVAFDAEELPERIIVHGYKPPFTVGIYIANNTASRIVHVTDGVGSCKCSRCQWCIDPYDRYCRRCGASLTETRYERDKNNAEDTSTIRAQRRCL